jgi:hypothetical protein
MNDQNDQTSRPEAAFVLLLIQSTFWVTAGISAFPFVLAGEVFMAVLGAASLVLASLTVMLAISVVRRRHWSRRWTIALEAVCLGSSALLLAIPLGANHGPVSLMVNIALPLAVIVLLRGKRMRAAFARQSGPLPG